MTDVDPRWTCNRKRRYGSEKEAHKALVSLMDRGRTELNIYGCTYCGGWHIGHINRRWAP